MLNEPTNEIMAIQGVVQIEVLDANTGAILHTVTQHNKIPQIGRNYIGFLLKGAADAPTDIAVGTGSAATLDADTTLGAEVYRSNITQRIAIANGVRFRFLLASTAANGSTLTEAGIFGPQLTLNNYMLSRVVYTGISKTLSVAISYTWDITYVQVN